MIAPVETSAMDKAREAWGAQMPLWIEALAKACDATSQIRVARQIDRSPPVISQVLTKKYKAGYGPTKELVENVLLRKTLDCPALGTIRVLECNKWRARAPEFSNVNSQYAQMYRACNRCPVNQEGDAE